MELKHFKSLLKCKLTCLLLKFHFDDKYEIDFHFWDIKTIFCSTNYVIFICFRVVFTVKKSLELLLHQTSIHLSITASVCHKNYIVHSTIYFYVLIYTLSSTIYHSLHVGRPGSWTLKNVNLDLAWTGRSTVQILAIVNLHASYYHYKSTCA